MPLAAVRHVRFHDRLLQCDLVFGVAFRLGAVATSF